MSALCSCMSYNISKVCKYVLRVRESCSCVCRFLYLSRETRVKFLEANNDYYDVTLVS